MIDACFKNIREDIYRVYSQLRFHDITLEIPVPKLYIFYSQTRLIYN